MEKSLEAVEAEAEAVVPSLKERKDGVVLDNTLMVLVAVAVQDCQLVLEVLLVEPQELEQLVELEVLKELLMVEIMVLLVVLEEMVEDLLLLVVQVQVGLRLVELKVVLDSLVLLVVEVLLEQQFEENLDSQ